MTIDTNLSPSTGTWTFNSNATDQPGGTAFQFNPTGGTITISTGVTVTLEGTSTINGPTVFIYGTLIIGATQLSNNGSNNIVVEPGGTLIINGDLTDKDNSGSFVINGALIVNGNLDNQTGSVTVGGTGTINTTGTITQNGGSTIFGSGNNCNVGPCSGTNLTCTFSNAISPNGGAICSGSNTGTLTANSTGASPSYQWQSSTTSATTGFTDISGATASTFAGTGLTQTTWYSVKKTVGGCTSSSAAIQFTVLPTAGGWVGSTSTDWSVSSNWCSGVPTSSTDVIIANAHGISNMPSILNGVSAVCRNLTINNTSTASTVTIAASGTATLSIHGDFTNNGTFTDNSTSANAGVKLVGAVAQTIAGTTQNTFNNLTIANTSGATPAIKITTNNVIVNSNLTMTSGMVNLNGYTISLGTAAGSAGTLTYTAQWIYGGNFQRWFPTTSITVGNVSGQFPVGTSTDYRPIFFGNAGLSAGGTIKVSHTGAVGTTAVSPTFTDNTGTVAIRSNSFWAVTTGNALGTGTHNIQTQGTGFGTVGAVTDLRQTLVNSISPGSDGAHAGTTSNPIVNRTGLTTANLSNNFYWGSINSATTPLPIELISFSATSNNYGVDLKWETASEVNNNYFTVLRSSSGDNFKAIGITKGSGTTNISHTYKFMDFKPVVGNNYYQLSQTDFDGKSTISEAILVDVLSIDPLIKIFPNPSSKQQGLNVEIGGLPENSSIELRIENMQGVSISSTLANTNLDGTLITKIATSNFSPGLYILTVQGAHFKFIIE